MAAKTRCLSCRWPLTEGARFCARCGSAIPSSWHVAASAMPGPPTAADGLRRRTGQPTALYARTRTRAKRRSGWGWLFIALAAGGAVAAWYFLAR